MKDQDSPTIISIPTATTTASVTKKETSESNNLFGKKGYKLWVLAAIILLAIWSVFTGSVTLKWSAGNLTSISDSLDFPIHADLDVLEVEEKEKLVRQMWDVYTQSRGTKLPKFWQEAFEAAYEALVSDVPSVRNDAVSEIAKMAISYTRVGSRPQSLESDKNANYRKSFDPQRQTDA